MVEPAVTAPERIRVVLSDDHPIVRAGIRDFLQRVPDIEVVGEAMDGDQAYDLVQRLQPDVLLLDMEMPGTHGVEVAARLHAEKSPVRVLALSAYDSIHYIQSTLEAGAYGYLVKEEMPENIVAAVRGVARGTKGWLSERVAERRKIYCVDQGAPLDKLSERELEILKLIGQGCDNLTISELLCISDRTVRNHASSIYNKLGFHTRAELVAWAWESGLVPKS